MDDQQKFYCYLLSIKKRTLLYIGYSENLKRRVEQHKAGRGALFTKKYSVFELIYFEEFLSKEKAKSREKQLKNWHKEWKWNFVKESNPTLKELNSY
jgi:putative endonuclease